MPSLRTHSHLADIQEQELQDGTLTASAKQSKHVPAIQLSSNSGVSFIEIVPTPPQQVHPASEALQKTFCCLQGYATVMKPSNL